VLSSNIKELQKFFKDFPKKVEESFDKAALKGMIVFQGKFTRQQLSGRKGALGVNRITGALANSFGVLQNKEAHFTQLTSNCPYAHVHEHALGFNGWIYPKSKRFLAFKTKEGAFVFAKQVYIPKRLDLYGMWEKEGYDMVMKAFAKQLTKVMYDNPK
jgi:hypothetical protein